MRSGLRRELRPRACVRLLAQAALLLTTGCVEAPFRQVEMCSVEGIDPIEARDRFESALPSRFNLVDSVVFEYRGRRISSLGMIGVDLDRGNFRLVCLTPMGVTTLDISGDRKGDRCEFALKGFLGDRAEKEDLARAMGGDIRKMYFDMVPPAGAAVRKGRNTIVFSIRWKGGTLEYVFAGAEPVLIEKRYYAEESRVCRVRFYEYVRHGGRLYPGGIIVENRRYGYRLIVRLREIRDIAVE